MHSIRIKLLFIVLSGFCLCKGYSVFAQSQHPSFRHLTVEDGLSHNWVKAILKDQQGFMWFGTFNGLNRYDGRQMRIFQSDTVTGLSDNVIECMAEDGLGQLWIGTFSGGLNRYEPATQRFIAYHPDVASQSSLPGNRINALYADAQGNLWIGTDAGLARYQPASDDFFSYRHEAGNVHSILPGAVTAITQDHNGLFWIGTESGLSLFTPETKTWTHYRLHQHKLVPGIPKSIYEDKYGQLWIGTWGNGVVKYDLRTGVVDHITYQFDSGLSISHNAVLRVTGDDQHRIFIGTENGGLNILDLRASEIAVYEPNLQDPRSINSNSIHTVYYDPDNGFLWTGTYNGGVNYFSIWDKPFEVWHASVNGLSNNHITSIAEDKSGHLWIGTDGGGINQFHRHTGTFTYFNQHGDPSASLQSDATLTLLSDRHNAIWAGSFNGGIDVIRNGKVTHYTHDPNDPGSLSGPHVNVMYEDKRGNIWAGTMSGGLNLFEPATGTFKRYRHDPKNESGIIDDFIYALWEDRTGKLLVLTGKGIEVYDYRTDQFSRFESASGYDIGVPVTLMEDSQGNLWVGSQEKGLFRFDRTGVKVNQYTKADGLPSNSICGILEDETGNLWVSTQRGLCKFEEGVLNPERVHFHSYSTDDGLQGSEFKTNAFCKLRDGRMAFGGQNGFNVFDPAQIKHNTFVPPVKITGFRLFNREVKFGEGEVLPAPVEELEEIVLNHHQSVFTFEFAALNYLLPEKNQFAYRMDGFEDEWNQVGTQRTATYSNLDPGEYVFRVKASNNDGVWNDTGTSIRIRIIPPWYERTWVRICFIAFGILMVIGYFRLRTYQLRKSRKELQRQVELSIADVRKANAIIEERQQEILLQNTRLVEQNLALEQQTHEIREMADEIRELNSARTTFFSNISKELKAPLDLIVRQIEDMTSAGITHQDQLREKQNTLYSNARNLVARIKQLLDFSSIEEMQDNPGEEDWQELIQATTILIIDPDPDPVFLLPRFAAHYHFAYAANGADGWRMVMDNLPDVIVCDHQLADGSALGLCHQIRLDQRTSHIPIIMMSSRHPDEHTLSEMMAVADDHIAKPIPTELLDVKIRNIFLSRQKMRDYFFKGTTTLPDHLRVSAADEQFLQKAASVVKDHLEKSAFGVDEFSAQFGMSRRNVLRKMKAVTGLSINEYIRNTRLHEAYSLLQQGNLNVSEIAYTVGFTDPKYFSNCFKKLFGKLPSEIRSVEAKSK